jgi:hypothetical protein
MSSRRSRSAPSAYGCDSSTREFVPQSTCIYPTFRWIRCPVGRCVGLCPSSSKPRGIEGSRILCRRAASRGACVGVHEACGSDRWHPPLPPRASSRGRLQPNGSPRAGCLFGRPQHGASSPSFPYLSDSYRSFDPPGGGHTRRVQRSPLPVDLIRFS